MKTNLSSMLTRLLHKLWKKRSSQRSVAESLNVGRKSLKLWEKDFVRYGAVGLLPKLSELTVDSKLEKLAVLIKSCRPHECASFALRMADGLEIPNASLDRIRQIQRCYGYGQRLRQGRPALFPRTSAHCRFCRQA